jgi:hypothetical protein
VSFLSIVLFACFFYSTNFVLMSSGVSESRTNHHRAYACSRARGGSILFSMIEKTVETSNLKVFTIHDTTTDESFVFELEEGVRDTQQFAMLDQATAQSLIAQEQQDLQVHDYDRRRVWGYSAAVGAACAALNATVSLAFDSDTYSKSIILGGSGILGGAAALMGIATGEFINVVSRRAVPRTNEAVEERIRVIQANTEQQ